MIQRIRTATKLFFPNLLLFGSIVLTVWLPGSILLVYLRMYVFPTTTGGNEIQILLQEFRVSNVIELAFGPLYVGAILHAASQLKQGLHPTYRQSMSYAAKRSFKLLLTRIGTGFIVLLGLIVLIIPGIVLSLRFALIDAIVVLEGLEGVSARNLSMKLTKGKEWQILGTMILTFIGLSIAIFVLSFSSYSLLSLTGQSENFLIAVICECISNLLLGLLVIVLFLFYWDAKNQIEE
jgi:hypothetical protein